MSVRVRFAPSPTGPIHIGNVRVAIFNWLFARHEGGKFLLRVEDTDRERCTQQSVDAILDVMSWLGLDYDEPALYQSQRIAAHTQAAEALLSSGAAYKEDKGGTGKGECVIFRMGGRDRSYEDLIRGVIAKKGEDLADFVILRSDGSPTFHLANVVDDVEMRITHVIRGDDHIENTFKHIALAEALGAPAPRYGHLPMVVNDHGKPYSKRDGDFFVGEFRDRGFLAEALFNHLALLGWSPGDDREKLSRAEMIQAFTLDRVKSSPARMDFKKLMHMNHQYVTGLPAAEFIRAAAQMAATLDWAAEIDAGHFERVCALMQSRTTFYSAIAEWKYFFSNEYACDEKAFRKAMGTPAAVEGLARVAGRLGGTGFTEPEIEQAIRAAETDVGLAAGKLNQPIRLAVTGTATGAGIYETMALLGRERSLARLASAPGKLAAT